jgi:hypothetical protein
MRAVGGKNNAKKRFETVDRRYGKYKVRLISARAFDAKVHQTAKNQP